MNLCDVDATYIYSDLDRDQHIAVRRHYVAAHDRSGCEIFMYWTLWPLGMFWSRDRAVRHAWAWLRARPAILPDNLDRCRAQIAVLQATEPLL